MPTMTVKALEAPTTCILIHTDCLGCVPLRACICRILKKLGLASIVLPIVRVNAGFSLVR